MHKHKPFNGYKFNAAAEGAEELLIYGDIGGWWSDNTAERISDELKKRKGKDITVRVNSYGGEAYAGIAIHNLLKNHDGKVNIYVDGIAASAASIIAMAGTLHMPKNSTLMIHNAWTLGFGNKADFQKTIDALATLDKALAMTYQGKTGLELSEIEQMMNDETYMLGEVAKEKGFADVVTDEAVDEVTANAFLAAAKMQRQANADSIRQMAAKLNKGGGTGFDEWPDNRSEDAPAYAQGDNDKNENEVKAMDIQTLKAEHPELFAAVFAEGVKAERERLKGIDEAGVKGFDKLVNDAKYGENPLDSGAFALAVLKEQKAKGKQFLADVEADATEAEITDVPAEQVDEEAVKAETQAKIKAAVKLAKGGRE